jgi:hypothetical protein
MKTKYLTLLLGLSCSGFLSAQFTVDQWNFNDGTSLTTTTNNGTWNSAWNADLDGSSISGGSLILNGDSKVGQQATIDPVRLGGTDKYLLEVTFSGWDFSNVDAVDAWVVAIGVRDSGASENWLGRAYLRWDGTVDLRAQTNTDAANNPNKLVNVANDLAVTNSSNYTVGVEFDFDTGLVRYLVNGSETHSFTDGLLQPTDMALFTISRFGAGTTWDDADGFVSIDSITLTNLTAVPEPGTFALLMGVFALGFIQFRRRRQSGN